MRHTKITIMGRALVPDISVIDPRLLTTMPERLNAATGLDALTHGIEAFVSLAHGPLTDHHALQAIAMVNGNLARTIHRPDDIAARASMAQAALEAGLAFTNAILGATHAMSHQVGGMLDLPHGVVNGVLLPHVIRFNGAELPERFVPIAQAMGLDVAGAPPARPSSWWPRRCARSATRSACPAGSAPSACGRRTSRGSPSSPSPTRASPPTRAASVDGRHGDVPGGAVSGRRQDHDFRARAPEAR